MSTGGVYLVFDTVSHGTLFAIYSKAGVENSMCYFQPSKPVPEFKYANGGKSELVREIQKNHTRYFEGLCSFCKMCKSMDGILTVFDVPCPKPFMVVLTDSENDIFECRPNAEYSLKNMTAIACVPKQVTDFQVQRLSLGVFFQKGKEKGHAMAL